MARPYTVRSRVPDPPALSWGLIAAGVFVVVWYRTTDSMNLPVVLIACVGSFLIDQFLGLFEEKVYIDPE